MTTNTAAKLETVNLYKLTSDLQSALRMAQRSPLHAPRGVSFSTQEKLQTLGLIDDEGKLTTEGCTVLETSTPEVGMGVTQASGSDSYAWTVIEVISSKRVVVQEDRSVRSDKNGLSESQTYMHVVGGRKECKVITLRRDGYWRPVGSTKVRGHHFTIGHRRAYRDPSF